MLEGKMWVTQLMQDVELTSLANVNGGRNAYVGDFQVFLIIGGIDACLFKNIEGKKYF